MSVKIGKRNYPIDTTTTLDISQIYVETLPDNIGDLVNLEDIYIENEFITTIPDSIGNLVRLKKMVITSCKSLTSIPDSIGSLQNLERIYITTNKKLTKIPESIGNLQNLLVMKLNGNKLTTLPESIGRLQKLESIIVSYNQLTSLPESIGNLINLKDFDLINNQLTTLPESIGNLQNLLNLRVSGNQLTTLPESIGRLQNLEGINLERNQLTRLPESIGNLQNLKYIEIYNNQLTTLPESIGNLQNLEDKLFLSNNQLTTLPESIGRLVKIKNIILYQNKLTTLPESIGNLQNLQQLFLMDNQLTTLPESIGNLKELQILNLDDNQLTTLPESIGNLKELHTLRLDNNQLNIFPPIGNLTKLEKVFLRNNQLTTIIRLPNLAATIKEFRVGNNPFTDPEFIGKDEQEIFNMLFVKEISHDKIIMDKFIGPNSGFEYDAPYHIEMSQEFVKQTQYKPLGPENDDLKLQLSLEPKPHVVYACPEGHLHTVGDCGIPIEITRCDTNGCKLYVGGLHHMLVPGSYIVYHDKYYQSIVWYGSFPVQSYSVYKRLVEQANKARLTMDPPEPEIILESRPQEEIAMIARPLQEDDVLPDMYLHGNVKCKICYEDIILGEDNLYILPSCGHLVHKNDLENYRQGDLNNIFEYQDGNVIEDSNMAMRKCPECTKQFAFGKSKSKSKSKSRNVSKVDTEKFFNFIKETDINNMKTMINQGYDINTLSTDGNSPIDYTLELLIFAGNKQASLDVIKFLIENGVIINENKNSIISSLFTNTNGGLEGDHAESVKNIVKLVIQKARENPEKISLSTMKGQSKKCDKAYTNRLLSIFNFIQNNSELSAFNNLVVNYCLFANKINFKDGLMSVNIVKNSLKNFYKYINIIPKDLLVHNCTLYKGIDLPPFDIGSKFFFPLPFSTAEDKSIVKQFAKSRDNIITILKIHIDKNIKYFPTSNFIQGYEILLPPGHITITKIDIKDNIKLTTIKYKQISNLDDLKQEYKKLIDKGILNIRLSDSSDC